MPEYYPLSNTRVFLLQKAYNPAQVNANTQAANATTLTITGLAVSDYIIALKPTQTQGLFLKMCVATAANTATFTFENITGSNIDPGSETYTFIIFRQYSAIDDELA